MGEKSLNWRSSDGRGFQHRSHLELLDMMTNRMAHPWHGNNTAASFSTLVGRSICLFLVCMGPSIARAQTSPLLEIKTFQVSPVFFTFDDLGTGASSYQLEFSESLGTSASWSPVLSSTVTDLGGGQFEIQAPDPLPDVGFYRIRGVDGTVALTASFNMRDFDVTEGGTVEPLITLNAPYTGIVRYAISGSVESGDYVNLTGEVMVDGTSARLPVSFTDNNLIGQLKFLTLTLLDGDGYDVGAGSTTTITVDENDAEWRGTFRARETNLGFLLQIQQLNGAPTALLSSDDLGLFPTNQASVAVTFSSDIFEIDSSTVPLDPASTPFETPVQLELHLEAANGVEGQSVTPSEIEGIGTLISQYPARPYLNTTNMGTFFLFKSPTAPSTNQVELVDNM